MSITSRYDIQKLVLRSGICPYDSWFETLPEEVQFSIDARLLRGRLGNFGDVNVVGAGVWEFKFRIAGGIRIYYGLIGRTAVVLLNGGKKSSQTKDIANAKKLFSSWKRGELSDADH